CIGFSDFSMIGMPFDKGFAPYAVAIHIIYLNKENEHLNIKHFVSDSNKTNKNTALKFSEAAKKMVTWGEKHPDLVDTIGYNKIKEYQANEHYPGLGIVKRYSLMHHLEVIGAYLDEHDNK
ncbi:sce7725 family protein, partial [Enterococcus canintestini]|uniref:sce7725 family protein n=1 Tax=Enterococcus canintestini TaxID=317010 RepID=UPI003993BE25